MNSEMSSVVRTTGQFIGVMVPTFRRPDLLLNTLKGLEVQETSVPFKVFVVDNDAELGEGEQAALAWGHEAGFADRLQTRRVAQRGLSNNRNGGLELGFSDPSVTAIAMIDDDAVADPGWITAIARALEDTDAMILGGPTIYCFEDEFPPWVINAEMFGVPYQKSGLVERLRSSNNCIITRNLYEQLGPTMFHPSFNATGGEDAHLFARCHKLGLASRWIADATVRELVPAHRCTDDWIVQRHKLSAANNARIDSILNGTMRAYANQSKAIFKEVAAGVLKKLSPKKETRFEGRLRFAGVAGRLDGLKHRLILHDTQLRLRPSVHEGAGSRRDE